MEQLVMNLRFPKCVVGVLGELDAESKEEMCAAGGDGGTTYVREPSECLEENHAASSPFLACQLLVFFALAKYRMVKITHCCSEMVL
jgi:hypothetical protein